MHLTRHLRIVAVLIGVGTIAVACGGSQETPQEKWAAGFCGALTTWRGELEKSSNSLSDTGNLSANGVRDAVTGAVDATRTLTSDLEKLGPPETASGNEIDAQIASLKDGIAADGDALDAQIGKDSQGISGAIEKVSAIISTIRQMITRLRTTFDAISGADPAGELRTALDANKDCQALRT